MCLKAKFRKKLIAPSILSADFSKLGEEMAVVMAAGADWIHVDVMDGHFVDNLTIGAPVVKSLRKSNANAFLDVHLMIERPEKYIDDFIKAGSSAITIHVESTLQVEACLKKIRAANIKAGITLRPKTDVAALEPYWDFIDMVLVMTVEPGFGGQSFMSDQIPKIEFIRKKIDEQYPHVLLEVDGGVNDKTIAQCKDVDVVVAGNYIFSNDYKKSIAFLKAEQN